MSRMVVAVSAAGLLAGCGWQIPYPQQAVQTAPAPPVVVVREPAEPVVEHVYHEVQTPVVVSPTVEVRSEPDRYVVVRGARYDRCRPRHPRVIPVFRRIFCPPRPPAPPHGRRNGPGYRPQPPPGNRRRGGPPPNNRQREQPPPNYRRPQPDPPGQRGVRVRGPSDHEAARPGRTGRG
jgi:hypothetical protein